MTLFKTRAGTMLTKETLICTRNERNFVQLSNIQAVFSANAARKSRLLRCFSPLPTLPYLFHPFKWNSSGHLRWKFIFSYHSDDPPTLNWIWRSNLSVLYRWKLEVSLVELLQLLLLQRYCLSDILEHLFVSGNIDVDWEINLFGYYYIMQYCVKPYCISNWRNLVN